MSKKRTPAKSPGTPTSFAFGAAAAAFGSASSGAFSTSASSLSYAAEPPDLSGISDSSVVVLFKNLSKKDETTKSRALEELQAKLASSEDVEEAVTAAWVGFLCPRTRTGRGICLYIKRMLRSAGRLGGGVGSNISTPQY